ncbi:DnaJ-like chaperone [Gordonia phage Jambalaya]|uniref:DnaJ-like chaperone n=1 Tax=Gordonia phage Jambalaya TaxID=2743985 RepID=A0A7D5FRA7_9CAUD|nr:DnaJ-like chaperone [Gordonia phage Jambalaya]QLF84127.1 DnaJ-like chaperone [Gordonia phage Jambalaya]
MSNYPPGMTLRPIERWPRKLTVNRERSPFSAPWKATLELLERELSHLSADPRRLVAPSVLQIAMREQDFRLDGLPRANARPEHPGVILSVESHARGSLSFPCDKYLTWQDNLRAIALSLEALRKVDRYGTTPNAEQYTGWAQLPSASTVSASLTVEEAEATLRRLAGDMDDSLSLGTLAQVYRRARAVAHPDRHHDDRRFWDAVEASADVLRAAGRL